MASLETHGTSSHIFMKLLEKLDGNQHIKTIRNHLDGLSKTHNEIEEETQSEKFLSWARYEKNIKIIGADVPSGILPSGKDGQLLDVKVFVRNGPDDAVYDNNKAIRDRVARGNSFLQLNSGRTFCVLQAMKKFTGGLGDDDDREAGDMMVWEKYFTKPFKEADHVVSTEKANGEAAHLSCFRLDGQLILCGGSKNVHLLFNTRKDIDLYVESRYRIATEICHSVMDYMEGLSEEARTDILEFLADSRYTAVFEILSPAHQHVVNLSHLKRPVLKFISWTRCELEPSEKLEHLNVVPPQVGIEIAQCLGLDPISYKIVHMKDLDEHMKKVRQGRNVEGEVLYFLDKQGQVIGLLKKKSVWYIVCRAIREKVKRAVNQSKQNPDKFSLSRHLHLVERRMKEIQKWLNLDHQTTQEWTELGSKCVKWALHAVEQDTLPMSEVQDLFPVYWSRFLKETDNSDLINVGEEVMISGDQSKEGACAS
ncbi:uncharacterized protein LOC128242961 [Mya arenaria]|uniref:uncharacterized protein LOC128242961 n=1 Tax=Mya arenaria TaxID=6604 RepID=UPI0022E8CEBF|nr:uncharacterized protein LOC128242961 [Mya arenaria]